MARYVIFVPGLGDSRTYGQNVAVTVWKLAGLRPVYLPLGWSVPEGYEQKHRRLLACIDRLLAAGHAVSLVGVSAGASAVINALAQRPELTSVVCISGKINHPETVGAEYYRHYPDFEESLSRVAASLTKIGGRNERMLTVTPWRDSLLPSADMLISGSHSTVVPGWSHASGIFFALVIGWPRIARFIKAGPR